MKHSAISDHPDPAIAPLSAHRKFGMWSLESGKISPVIYWAGLAGILLMAFLVRLPGGFSRLILHDEFFHYLAGLSYARDGTLAIGNGYYVRAAPYTVLTGLSLRVFGESLLALRLPAIVSGTFLVVAVAAWLGRASRMAGLIGGVLLALDYFAIQLSDYARFYTLHALMIWLAAVGSYALITKPRRQISALSLGIAIAASLTLAINLQILTLFVILALCVWVVADYAVFPFYIRSFTLNRGLMIALFCTAAVAIAAALLSPLGGLIFSLYDKFWSVAPWSEDLCNDLLFYVRFMRTYGLLAYIFPLALVAAWHVDRRRALFCAILFVIPLLIASIGPQKAPRYIFYTIPFFLGIWALAATWIFRAVRDFASRHRLSPRITPLLIALAAIILLIGSTTFRSTLRKMKTFSQTREVVSTQEMNKDKNFDWQPWMPALRKAVSPSGLIIGVDDLRTLYFFGRLDLMLNRTIQWDISRHEFVHDPRTGAVAISQPDSIKLVMDCTAGGTIIVPRGRWREYSVVPATADVIEQRAIRVSLPGNVPFRLYRWQNSAVPNSEPCRRLAIHMR